MNDRKLLELAAKAAGLEIVEMETKDCLAIKTDYCNHDYWNPLTDDGDALRLAVKLEMCIQQNDQAPGVAVWHERTAEWVATEYGDDPYATTRRAIVRAAAEIGNGV